jgi:hypothetical protein
MFGEPSGQHAVFCICGTFCMKKFMPWIRRIGVVGFLFFLIKGLIWLAVFFGVGTLFTR